jgi:hypothetical protein
MRITTKTNVDEVLRDLDKYVADVTQVAVPRALNKLARQVQTTALRLIADEYDVSPGQMRKYLRLTLSSGPDVPASIVAKGSGFPLVLFRPRKHPKGIMVRIKGRDILIPHAFLLTIGGGDRQVFARGSYTAREGGRFVPTGERMGRFRFGRKRFPISLLRTFGPPETLRNRRVVEGMIARMQEQAAKVLAQEIRFAVSQRR